VTAGPSGGAPAWPGAPVAWPRPWPGPVRPRPWPRRPAPLKSGRTTRTWKRGMWRTVSRYATAGAALFAGGAGDVAARGRVGLDVLELVVVHHADVAAPERLGDRQRHLRLGLHHLGAHRLDAGAVLLLLGHGHGAALLGLGLRDALVGLGLVGLQLSADVAADVDVGDVDGEDLEGRARVEALGQDRLRDDVRVLEHALVGLSRADGGDDALADARDDRLLAGAAHEPLEVRAHRDAGRGDQLDAVLGDGRDVGRLDHARVHGHAHGVEDVAAGEVDGGRPVEPERDARLVGGDQCVDDRVDVAAGQVVGLELVLVHLDAGLVGLDQRQDDLVRRHAPEAHGDEAGEAHLDAGGDRRDPQPDR